MGTALHEVLATLGTLLAAAISGDTDQWTITCQPSDPTTTATLRLEYERVGTRQLVTFDGPSLTDRRSEYPDHEPYVFEIDASQTSDGTSPRLRLSTAQDRMHDTRAWVKAPARMADDPAVIANNGHILRDEITRMHTLDRTWLRTETTPDGTSQRIAYHWTETVGPTHGRSLNERKATYRAGGGAPWPEMPPANATRWGCRRSEP